MEPAETAAANVALMDYAKAGVKRSLRSLAEDYARQMASWKEQRGQQATGGVQATRPPTSRLTTLFGWSIHYEWQARVARWDELQAKKLDDAYDAERVKWRGIRLEAAKGMFDTVSQAMLLLRKYKLSPRSVTDVDGNVVEYPPLEVNDLDVAKLATAMDKVADLLRKEFGDDARRVDLTMSQIDYSDFTDDELQRVRDGENPIRVLSDSRRRRARAEKAQGEPASYPDGVSSLAEDAAS
jgi:hypothetical protein